MDSPEPFITQAELARSRQTTRDSLAAFDNRALLKIMRHAGRAAGGPCGVFDLTEMAEMGAACLDLSMLLTMHILAEELSLRGLTKQELAEINQSLT